MTGESQGKRPPAKKSDTQDPVKNFEKWKKKYTKTKVRVKREKKQNKKPEWQIERENIKRLVDKYSEINVKDAVKFSDFPVSKKTLKGLMEAQYRQPTEIQRQTIGFALQGKDVLGAAKTGSGKTLAFLIPVLECLYRQQWMAEDGLGALIISPTRELAYQTFEVLRKVGKNHEFSAGLIIGGKDLQNELERIHRTNIIICTPGRLLQHMDETSTFHASNLQILVLDEADRILDMGFADTMNAIVENLPKTRQTLLFSATQTKSVKDLARLSLKDPEYIWVHEKAKFSTPATLEQNYVVCELQQKVNMLFSFMKSHLQKKVIVFFACCKEVQYMFRVFCRLRPGLPILALHGKQQQMKRMEVYNDFIRKKAAVLFATDIAARGLDFPAVNWVLQFDCPEDASTYIHRVGRTARYKEGGEALLVLLPSEEKGMIAQLQERKVPINKIHLAFLLSFEGIRKAPKAAGVISRLYKAAVCRGAPALVLVLRFRFKDGGEPGEADKLTAVQQKLEAFLAQEKEQKERAQRCFVSYLRSVYLMKNKDVFDVLQLPLEQYAASLGLAVAPRVRFLSNARKRKEGGEAGPADEQGDDSDRELQSFRAQVRGGKNTPAATKSATESQEEPSEEEDAKEESGDSDEEEEEGPADRPAGLSFALDEDDDEDQDEDLRDLDLLTVKRRDIFRLEEEDDDEDVKDSDLDDKAKKKPDKESRFKEAKKAMKRNFKVNTKMTFTDDGEMVQQWPPLQRTAVPAGQEEEDDGVSGINMEEARERLRREDQEFDKQEYSRKVKQKHREKRLKEKAERREASKRQKEEQKGESDSEEEAVAYLDHGDDEEEFDPSSLPDPDKHVVSESEDRDRDDSGKGARKRSYSDSSSESDLASGGKRTRKEDATETAPQPLDTGLSLAEDEELVLHLLRNKS
ncbi:probable ATP-dependent RNA helicase DDX10 [Conger conger]|uniref:probable ATP-dependent RNA helicase DDX10 n=1 Tax=Conger conger TaxID=82655 RepID=UPI002A59CA82|nr:probable ATP-dependent RNA helicase DDX10 [Conger conger]